MLSDDYDLIITELRLQDGPCSEELRQHAVLRSHSRTAVVTDYPSIAMAVRCARWGIHTYLAKPVSVAAILETLAGVNIKVEPPLPEQPLRLERAVWEYLHRAVTSAGSITVAAEWLDLDRRSLRRMLAKYPP
jgi:ActR/RegA family two-component response regulator